MKTHVNDRLHAPIALTLRQEFPLFNGMRIGLAQSRCGAVERRKISAPYQKLNPTTTVIQQVA